MHRRREDDGYHTVVKGIVGRAERPREGTARHLAPGVVTAIGLAEASEPETVRARSASRMMRKVNPLP
jgi:hypothetical protein